MIVLLLEEFYELEKIYTAIWKKAGHDVISLTKDDSMYKWNKEDMPDIVHISGWGKECFSMYKNFQKKSPKSKFLIMSLEDSIKYMASKIKDIDFISKKNGIYNLTEYVKGLQ